MRRQAKCYNLITRMLSGHWARGDVGGDVGGDGGGAHHWWMHRQTNQILERKSKRRKLR